MFTRTIAAALLTLGLLAVSAPADAAAKDKGVTVSLLKDKG